jgi:hypothetical protein
MNFFFAKPNDHVFRNFILTWPIWCSVWQLAWKWFVIHTFKVTSWTTGLLVWHSLILAKLARKWVVVISSKTRTQFGNAPWFGTLWSNYMAKLAIKWVVVICVQNHNTIMALLWFGAPRSSPTKLTRKWVIVIHVQKTTQDGTPLICHSWIKCGKTC